MYSYLMQRSSTPELVPEDVDPIWSKGREQIISSSRGVKQRIATVPQRINDLMGDPRFGPMLLLGALMSFGLIYLRRNQPIKPKESDNASDPKPEVNNGALANMGLVGNSFFMKLLVIFIYR